MLNKKAFAELCGVTQHTAVRWEKSDAEPTADHIALFAKLLNYPIDFFYGSDIDEAIFASFRSQTSMSASIRDASLAAGSIGFLLSDWVEARFDLPSIKVPDLHLFEAEQAARVLREEWSLGERPITNMVHLLESKGVRVFSLAENTIKVNAYSIWRQDKPYVFLNNHKSAESSRFDAAHELAHLVLHQDGGCTGREAEDQAHKFAAALLMPKGDVMATIPHVKHVEQLIKAKARWKVSVAALNYRLNKLGMMSSWKYRDICIELTTRGFSRTEPHPIEREKSVVWEKVLRALWSDRITLADVARELSVPEAELSGLVFGMVVSPERPSVMRNLKAI